MHRPRAAVLVDVLCELQRQFRRYSLDLLRTVSPSWLGGARFVKQMNELLSNEQFSEGDVEVYVNYSSYLARRQEHSLYSTSTIGHYSRLNLG